MPPRSSNFFKSRLFVIWLALIGVSFCVSLFFRYQVSERLYSHFFEGEVTFTSTPPGAEILFDGKHLGITPQTRKIRSGTYSLVLQRGSWQLSQQVTVKAHEAAAASAIFHYATVTFMSQPAGAEVVIDGKHFDTTPCVATEFPPGSHSVDYRKNGRSMTETIEAKEGEAITRKIAFGSSVSTIQDQKSVLQATLEPAAWIGLWRGWMDYDIEYGKKRKPWREEVLQVNSDLKTGVVVDFRAGQQYEVPMSVSIKGNQLVAEGSFRNDPYSYSMKIVMTRASSGDQAKVEITRRDFVFNSDQGNPTQSFGTMNRAKK